MFKQIEEHRAEFRFENSSMLELEMDPNSRVFELYLSIGSSIRVLKTAQTKDKLMFYIEPQFGSKPVNLNESTLYLKENKNKKMCAPFELMPVRDMDGSLGNKILNSGDLAIPYIDYEPNVGYIMTSKDEEVQNQIKPEDYLGSILETAVKTSK